MLYDRIPNKSKLAIWRHVILVYDSAIKNGKKWSDYWHRKPNIDEFRRKITAAEQREAEEVRRRRLVLKEKGKKLKRWRL